MGFDWYLGSRIHQNLDARCGIFLPTLFPGSLSYPSISHSVETGRREPWERGSFFACLPAIQEIIMYQIYFFAAYANQQGKHSLVSPMKARYRAAWLWFSNLNCQVINASSETQGQPILGFHCHAIENKIANRSVQKVQNLGNKRR